MRIATRLDGTPCLIDPDGRTAAINGYTSVLELIEKAAAHPDVLDDLNTSDAQEAELDAPIPLPRRNIICVGKNYRAHAAEFAGSGFDSSDAGETVPTYPVVFSKAPESITGPNTHIIVPTGLTKMVDYEAEIAVVIGKGGRFISPDTAMDHVFGYTLVNDVTARDLQKDHKQWFLGKSIDTFCPMGPMIVTADELSINDIRLQCHVNGELRQDASGSDLVFSIPEIIATVSRSMALKPGDIIATGTPAGVGIGLSPPVLLQDGDVVEVSAEGLGLLSNTVRHVSMD